MPLRQRNVRTQRRNRIRSGTRNQWRSGVMRSERLAEKTLVFLQCSLSVRCVALQENKRFQQRVRHLLTVRTRSYEQTILSRTRQSTESFLVAPTYKRHYTKYYVIMWPCNLRHGQDVKSRLTPSEVSAVLSGLEQEIRSMR